MQEKERKVQEIQILEQNLQNLLLQKQAFQMELAETIAAKREIENAGDDVFKIIGQLMIRKDKNELKKELEDKKKILELRLNSIEKPEKSLTEQSQSLRDQLVK